MGLKNDEPISEELKLYLREYTTELDVAKACEGTQVGFYTLRRIRLGEGNIANDNNKNALIGLMKIAVKNADDRIKKIRKFKKDITQIADCI